MPEFGSEKRLALHTILTEILGSDAVYFQSPPSLKMTYPCIVYSFDTIDTRYADSVRYKNKSRYTVTVIDRNADSSIPEKLLALEYCSFDRRFPADNLHHFTFVLYY